MNIFENMGSSEYSEEFKNFRTAIIQRKVEADLQNVPRRVATGFLGSGYAGSRYAYMADGGKWPYGLSHPWYSPLLDNTSLIRNARVAYHDSAEARLVVDRITDTVVDIGLRLEAMPDYRKLGITQEQAKEWAEETETDFNRWANDLSVSVDGQNNLYQLQRLYSIQQQRDNDIFVRFHYDRNRSLLNPLRIQFIDPMQIWGDGFTSVDGYQLRDDGILRNANGEETGYKVWTQRNGTIKPIEIPAVMPRSGLISMFHAFRKEYATQLRGYSRLSHALQEIENITDYRVSEIKKAINQSSLVLSVKPSKEADSSDAGFGDIATGGIQSSDAFGTAPVDPTEEDIPFGDILNYCPMPEATFKVPGSVGVFGLKKGEDIKPFANTSPTQSFDSFVNAFMSYLSASMGIPIEVLLMKFGQNYSASRATLLLFWRIGEIWRADMNAHFNNIVYEMWLTGEIAAGRKRCPGWQDRQLRAAWLQADWYGAPIPNIDPRNTAEAEKVYVELGYQTLERGARNHNGSSARANRAKLTEELAELPVPPWAEGQGGAGMTKSEDKPNRPEDNFGG